MSHHNTPEDYAVVNSIIHDMFAVNRVKNYQFNHGELIDALIKRSRELRETQREDYMADFINGMIRGIEECAKVLYENSKEVQ